MQVTSTSLIGLACVLPILFACSESPNSPVASVELLINVQPNQLLLGKKMENSAERCVYPVQVKNAPLACQQNDCGVQAFYWPVQAVDNGQRALLVSECSASQKLSSGQLLTNQGPTGDSGILIFQHRREGEGLWKNVQLPNGDYGVQLATEAAEGVLTYQQGRYSWEENPD